MDTFTERLYGNFKKLLEDYYELLKSNTSYKAIIGVVKDGEHPDEINPRGATWLEERENWKAEVERLRKHVQELELLIQKQ